LSKNYNNTCTFEANLNHLPKDKAKALETERNEMVEGIDALKETLTNNNPSYTGKP